MTPRLLALCSSIAGLVVAVAAGAQTSPDAGKGDNARALERCEATVVETLRNLRGKQAQEVQFVPAQRVVTPGEDAEIGVKGTGRYRGAGGVGAGALFSFSCSFNAKSGLTSGVVLRESGADAARSQPDWQPDISRVSPEACESATAHLLKEKHPRVVQIAMEPDTRRLQPGPNDHILLLGQGAVQRAPGMNAVPFSYSCEFDGRTGRLVAVKTSV